MAKSEVIESTKRERLFGDEIPERIVVDRLSENGVTRGIQITWDKRVISIWEDGQITCVGKSGTSGFFLRDY